MSSLSQQSVSTLLSALLEVPTSASRYCRRLEGTDAFCSILLGNKAAHGKWIAKEEPSLAVKGRSKLTSMCTLFFRTNDKFNSLFNIV